MQDTQISSAAETIGELEIITQIWISFEHQYAIRWRKNFFISLLIASITYWIYPSAIWVWGIVLIYSTLSLLTLLARHYVIQKKLKQSYQQIKQLKTLEGEKFKAYYRI